MVDDGGSPTDFAIIPVNMILACGHPTRKSVVGQTLAPQSESESEGNDASLNEPIYNQISYWDEVFKH